MENRHFTLVELLAVVVIITILATILVGGVTYAMKKADVSKTQAQLEALATALEAFKAEKGYYPPCTSAANVQFQADSGVEKLVLGSAKFSMQSKTGKVFIDFPFESNIQDYTDAWSNAFKYQCPGTHNAQKYDLWSTGADASDEDDDITNW